ncbi:hypothetical protein [uncultured Shimia sp.]|uniref:hypothetical protein n=1 Tax=uncultured Shimia sp. TaxID=573152 RepID=UPI0026103789|nr:hypothetical protein [uncultured Shimia sp.]
MVKTRNVLSGAVFAALAAFGGAGNAQDGDGMGLSDTQTNRVLSQMAPGLETCAGVEIAYRPDCFQQVYRSGARLLSNNAGYWEAEVALTRVGRNLYNFVRANGDSSADRIREGGFRLKAVTASSLPEAGALYRDNAAKAEDILRSGSAAETKYFEPIAELVGKYKDAIPQ